MPLNLQKNIFGLNFDINIETRLPAVQTIYDFRISRKWTGNEYNDSQLSKKFIAYALKRLPQGSFIIFDFDFSGYLFVQFSNLCGTAIADIPIMYENCYFRREEEIVKLLRDMEFKRYSDKAEFPVEDPRYLNVSYRQKDDRGIMANFGNDYDKAADTSLLIAEKLFKIETPGVLRYISGKVKYIE